MRTLQGVRQLYPAAADAGLAAGAVADSRKRFGVNRLTPLPREPLWKKFLDKFDEPIIKILLAAALLSMFVGLFPFAPRLAGVALGVVTVLFAVLFGLHRQEWIPSLLFVAAASLFVLGRL